MFVISLIASLILAICKTFGIVSISWLWVLMPTIFMSVLYLFIFLMSIISVITMSELIKDKSKYDEFFRK